MTVPKKSDGMDGERRRDRVNDLDCYFCGRWFPTFDRLAKHTYARHGPPTPGNEPKTATRPAFVPVTQEVESAMAKRSTKAAKPAARRGNALPTPADSGTSSEYNPFLKAENIGETGDEATLTLTGAPTRIVDGAYGEQIVCEVKFERKTYDWGINTDSPNYRMLFERFGKDSRKWRGAVRVVVKDSRNNRPFIAVAR
jgi:hypothetical protein